MCATRESLVWSRSCLGASTPDERHSVSLVGSPYYAQPISRLARWFLECGELCRQYGPAPDVELVVDVREVGLDGFGAHEELTADLLVREPGGDVTDHRHLGGSEALPSGARSFPLAARPLRVSDCCVLIEGSALGHGDIETVLAERGNRGRAVDLARSPFVRPTQRVSHRVPQRVRGSRETRALDERLV